MLALLGSGTSPNESLHAELNQWFRNQPELYITTLQLQLDFGVLAKLMAHSAAMYRPTLRQLRQQTVLSAVTEYFRIADNPWRKYCRAFRRDAGGLSMPRFSIGRGAGRQYSLTPGNIVCCAAGVGKAETPEPIAHGPSGSMGGGQRGTKTQVEGRAAEAGPPKGDEAIGRSMGAAAQEASRRHHRQEADQADTLHPEAGEGRLRQACGGQLHRACATSVPRSRFGLAPAAWRKRVGEHESVPQLWCTHRGAHARKTARHTARNATNPAHRTAHQTARHTAPHAARHTVHHAARHAPHRTQHHIPHCAPRGRGDKNAAAAYRGRVWQISCFAGGQWYVQGRGVVFRMFGLTFVTAVFASLRATAFNSVFGGRRRGTGPKPFRTCPLRLCLPCLPRYA